MIADGCLLCLHRKTQCFSRAWCMLEAVLLARQRCRREPGQMKLDIAAKVHGKAPSQGTSNLPRENALVDLSLFWQRGFASRAGFFLRVAS